MPAFTCVNTSTGEVLYSGVGDDPESLASESVTVFLEKAPLNSYRDLVNNTWEVFPDQPSPIHTWDWTVKAWVDQRTLEQHKADKLKALKTTRDTFLHDGFTWDSSRFDSDLVAQTRLLGLRLKAQGDPAMVETWRLQDNTWRQLNATEALAVWDTFEQHLRNAFQTFAVVEAQVIAAETIEQVEGVTWP